MNKPVYAIYVTDPRPWYVRLYEVVTFIPRLLFTGRTWYLKQTINLPFPQPQAVCNSSGAKVIAVPEAALPPVTPKK